MKKIFFLWVWDNYTLKKTILVMRISLFLLMIGTLQTFASTSYS